MKRTTWMPLVAALGIQAVVTLTVCLICGTKNVFSHPLGIVASTIGFLFLAYVVHFICQQDFIMGGCRPHAMGVSGSLLFLLKIMLLMASIWAILFSALEPFGLTLSSASKSVNISVLWMGVICLHAFYYALLLFFSRLRAKEDEVLYVNGKRIGPGESVFLWPWLIEEYDLCRHVVTPGQNLDPHRLEHSS